MPSPFDGLHAIGADETSYRKGYTHVTIVVDHERLRAASPATTASPIRFTQPISIRATATSLRAAELCAASSTPYTRSPQHPMGEPPPTQAPSVWAVLGFFIPLVGLVFCG